jgi:transglutaminase-like putative cysteine protease
MILCVIRYFAVLGAALVILCGSGEGSAFAQARAGGGGDRPPVTIKLGTDEITVGADGSYTHISHYEITPSNDSVAKNLAQQAFAFSEAIDDLQVTEAYTLKSDGRKETVDPTHIFVQSPQGSSQAPMFDDVKSKVVVFPDVAANDTIVFTLTKHSKEVQFPGQFLYDATYSRLVAWNEIRVTITVPKSLALVIESHDVTAEHEANGSNVVYRWHYSAPMPLTEDVAAVAPADREPRFFASTFKNYDELGHAFAALALPKAAVTPKIQSLADQTTSGIMERRAQAQKLYEWVSTHIRYVGIELGQGRVVPHDAETVLVNGYGDCKDHVVLFAALLKAKGIASEMVLINANNSYMLPDPPTLAQFNHLITWIPEFKLYADTTAAVAPFGTLPFVEYGKPVVHALAHGPTRHLMPLLAPGEATMSLKTVSQVTADGGLDSQSAITATGPFSFLLRQVATSIEAAGPERAIKSMLQQGGLTGTGGINFASAPSELGPSYTVNGHFEAQPPVPYTSGQGFAMPPGLRLLPYPGDLLIGRIFVRNLPSTEPTPCWSGSAVDDLSIEPPKGKHFAKVPADVSVTTENVTFSAHWALTDRIISVRRELTSKFDQALCSGALRKSVADIIPKIAAAYPTQISIVDD